MTLKSSIPILPFSLSYLFYVIFSITFISPVISQDCGGKICLNKSKCVLNQSEYICECPPSYYGPTCKNMINSHCNEATEVFCTNGGTCGSYIIDGCHYEGCHCDEEYIGAHCQYKKGTWRNGIPGEAAVPQINSNFYTKAENISCRSGVVPIGFMFISAGCICFFLAFWTTLYKYVKTAKKLKELQVLVTKELDRNHTKSDPSRRIVCLEAVREDVL